MLDFLRRAGSQPESSDKHPKALVTGVGPVSAIGCGRDPFYAGLLAGRHGFGPITLCDARWSESKIAAEVKGFDLSRYVQDGRLMARRMPRPTQLALAAGVLALHDAELDLDACDQDRVGILVGTSLGNHGDVLRFDQTLQAHGKLPPDTAFQAFHHSAACVLSSFFNIRGPIHTTSSGCNSGVDALGQALRMIQAGAVDAMLVVGTDCEVENSVLAALSSSSSLTTKFNDTPGRASRPFDTQRDGNVIGEGAAALLVESEAHARARGARAYARLAGYRIAAAGQNRQYSHDAPELDLEPCVRALSGAIADAGWTKDRVDLVNANGSSSVLYDRVEAQALHKTFGPRFAELPVHSIKSMLGQHGAGSSALQAVTACLALRRGDVPGTINHEETDPACGPIRVLRETAALAPRRVLMHSIGLGGFYYSAAAFEACGDPRRSGIGVVKWSAARHRRFQPTVEYQRPLVPWTARPAPHG